MMTAPCSFRNIQLAVSRVCCNGVATPLSSPLVSQQMAPASSGGTRGRSRPRYGYIVQSQQGPLRMWQPFVVAAALLAVVYGIDVYRRRGCRRESDRALYLTHWNYGLVTALILAYAWLPDASWRSGAAAAVAVVSLVVMVARLAFLTPPASGDTYLIFWDAWTHLVVPLLPIALLCLARHSTQSHLVPALIGVGVLEAWIIINAVVQQLKPCKRWVYGKAANPRLQSGRLQLIGALALAGVCAAAVVGAARLTACE